MKHNDLQAEFWDNASPRVACTRMTRTAVNELNDFFDFVDLSHVRTILEIGCGPGRFTLPLLRTGFHVTGTDVSSKSLEHLDQAARQEGLSDRLGLKKTAFSKAEFDQVFDLALCGNVIHHFNPQEKKKILKNIITSIRKGGKLAVFEPNGIYPLYLPWYLTLAVVGKEKGVWQAEKGILKSSLGRTVRYLTDLGLSSIRVKQHTVIPLRIVNQFPFLEKANTFLENLPVFNRLSAFFWLAGCRKA